MEEEEAGKMEEEEVGKMVEGEGKVATELCTCECEHRMVYITIT